MKLFTPFTISKKDYCDHCRGKINKRRVAENSFLDELFKFLYRYRFDFVLTEKAHNDCDIYIKKSTHTMTYIVET